MTKFHVKAKPAPAITKAGLKEYLLELMADCNLVCQTFYFYESLLIVLHSRPSNLLNGHHSFVSAIISVLNSKTPTF